MITATLTYHEETSILRRINETCRKIIDNHFEETYNRALEQDYKLLYNVIELATMKPFLLVGDDEFVYSKVNKLVGFQAFTPEIFRHLIPSSSFRMPVTRLL